MVGFRAPLTVPALGCVVVVVVDAPGVVVVDAPGVVVVVVVHTPGARC
jgi:hypothetical protein